MIGYTTSDDIKVERAEILLTLSLNTDCQNIQHEVSADCTTSSDCYK